MAKFKSRRQYNKEILTALGNKESEELGKLVLDLMENTNALYDALGIDDSNPDDEGRFEYTEPKSDAKQIPDMDYYQRLENEYKQRFMNYDDRSDRREIPVSQPTVDTITIGINPDTGKEDTALGEQMEIVADNEIFGEDYK